MTVAELLALDKAGALLAPETRTRVEEACREKTDHGGMPWYLRAFVTIGAWISSGFLFAFVAAVMGGFFRNSGIGLCIGLAGIGAAVGIRRAAQQIFLEQVCLSLSVAGHVLCLVSIGELTQNFDAVVLLSAALTSALYFLYPEGLHRFLSAWSTLLLTTGWVSWRHFSQTAHGDAAWWWHASVLLHLAGILVIFLPARAWSSLRPLGYATAVSLIALLLCPFGFKTFEHGFRVYDRLLCLPLIAAIPLVAAGQQGWRARPLTWLAVSLALGVLTLGNGVSTLVALLYLALGFRLQERGLLVLGILLVPAFTVVHYYSLETTLLRKSIYLMASGGSLLLLRLFLARTRWQPEEARGV